jgi:hypothetical protein
MSEYLIFDGETLDGPIVCEDLGVLRNLATRGGNRVMPGAPGQRATDPVRDELEETLVWFVAGTTDPTGTPQEPIAGVADNLEFYRDLFTTGGEHALELHLEGGVFEGTMQVVEYAQRRTGPQSATILTHVRVPSGVLTAP